MVQGNWVIDISHWNKVDFAVLKENGILAVILKATQGDSGQDQKYSEFRQEVLDAELLLGSYHFGVFGDGVPQAQHFLSVAGSGGILALDFETPPPPTCAMTVPQAEEFCQAVQAQTGKWPVIYADPSHVKILLAGSKIIPENCPLWVAEYNANPTDPVAAHAWPTPWKIRQYSDGSKRFNPDRFELGIDADQFNGTEDEMRAWWESQQV